MVSVFDGFISYSHEADPELASRLQTGVQRFATPWWRRRGLRIFRDETSLAADPHLWSSVARAMEDSEWFVMLASPEAASSSWVDREVSWWLDHKARERVLLVVTRGDLVWDAESGRLDIERSTAVPPALGEAFTDEPRWVDARWAREDDHLDPRDARFRDMVADVAAPLHGVPKDELASEDLRQHRRTVRTAWVGAIAVGLLAILAVGAGLVAVAQRNEARQQRAEARSQTERAEEAAASEQVERLIAQSRLLQNRQIDVAILLALEAQRRAPGRATDQVLLESLAAVGPLTAVRSVPTAANPGGANPVTDAAVLWRATGDRITGLNMATGEQHGETLVPRPGNRIHQVEDVGNGHLAITYDDGLIQLVDDGTGALISERNVANKPVLVRRTADGSTLAVNAQGGGATFLSLPELDPKAQVPVPISGVWISTLDGVIASGGSLGTSLQSVSPDGVQWTAEFGSPLRAIAADPAGDLMAGALVDGKIAVWAKDAPDDVRTLVDFENPRFGTALLFGPDGTLYVGRDDGAIFRLDTGSGNEPAGPFASVDEEVRSLWTDDEAGLLSVVGSDRWYQFRLDGLSPLADRLHDGERGDVIVASDDQFVTGTQPGLVEIRSTADGTLIQSTVVGDNAAVPAIARLSDAVVASVVEFSGVEIDQLRVLQDAASIELQQGLAAPFIADLQESSLVGLNDDGSERWRIPTDLPVVGLERLAAGSAFAALDVSGSVLVFDSATGDELQRFGRANPFFGTVLTPAGPDLLAVGGEISVRLELTDAGLELNTDGRLLGTAIASTDEEVVLTDRTGLRIVDATTSQPTRPDVATSAVVELAELLPAEDYLVMRFESGALALMDLQNRTTVPVWSGAPLTVGVARLPTRGFLTLDIAGQIDRWTMDPDEWRATACEVVGRDFSADEWSTFFPDDPYRSTCD